MSTIRSISLQYWQCRLIKVAIKMNPWSLLGRNLVIAVHCCLNSNRLIYRICWQQVKYVIYVLFLLLPLHPFFLLSVIVCFLVTCLFCHKMNLLFCGTFQMHSWCDWEIMSLPCCNSFSDWNIMSLPCCNNVNKMQIHHVWCVCVCMCACLHSCACACVHVCMLKFLYLGICWTGVSFFLISYLISLFYSFVLCGQVHFLFVTLCRVYRIVMHLSVLL